jgi:hypothetical protein
MRRVGFGHRPALINIDLANAWTRVGFRNSVSPLWLGRFETRAFDSPSESGEDRNGLASI